MKNKTAWIAALIMTLVMAGCGGIHFSLSVTSGLGRCTIEADQASDGETIETDAFSVSDGASAVIESALEKGEFRIEIAEATIIPDGDGPSDVIAGTVVETVTVGAGDTVSIPLEGGDYVFLITVVGDTNGKVTIRID